MTTTTHLPPPAPRVDANPQDIARSVERVRGLRFARVPPVEIVGPAKAKRLQKRQVAKAKRKLDGKTSRLRALRRRSRASLEFTKLAGVVGPGFKARQSFKSLVGAVIGEFDPSSRTVRVLVTPGESPEQRATVIAHELDHSLDNAHFPGAYRAIRSPNSERQGAAQALIEGTATVIARRFDQRHGYQAAVAGGQLLSSQNAGYGVPPVLAAQLRFPYTSGAHFVQALYERAHGWRLVNRAFRRPPTSSAQILDPGLWIHHVGYATVSADRGLGRPLRFAGQSISGQLDAELVLALALPADATTQASRGWDGGTIAVWERRSRGKCASPCRRDNAGVIADRWRSVGAAARFLAQLPTYLRVRMHAKPDGAGLWRIGDGFAVVALRGHGTAMAFAPTAAIARRIANGAATNADQAH